MLTWLLEALVLNFSFILMTFVLFGCGVKSKPVPPLNSAYPSYDTKFMAKEKAPTPTPSPSSNP